ncbi:hypothetical protein [Kutzneria albida]|uniref:Uncharacterized protein n=1 Tax=Kutzneria albida DSM 43870 TaxID=1449976 RepID=W5WBM2_9PSEU|nr:hypothetical protein [Kutzneria albida]AHH98272.1 hypothetical protein KALB_4910 [Kutzneria albida DSM 43870]
MFGKKKTEPVREDQVKRLHNLALDKWVADTGASAFNSPAQELEQKRAQAALDAAKRNSSAAEIAAARQSGHLD